MQTKDFVKITKRLCTGHQISFTKLIWYGVQNQFLQCTRRMRAQILNPWEPPVPFENRNELKLIRNTDGAYVNILVIA
mgnify:CR=1 FL=1